RAGAHARVAQRLELWSYTPAVGGSIPSARTHEQSSIPRRGHRPGVRGRPGAGGPRSPAPRRGFRTPRARTRGPPVPRGRPRRRSGVGGRGRPGAGDRVHRRTRRWGDAADGDARPPGRTPAARARGIVFAAALVGGTTLSTATLDRLLRRRPVVRTAATAAIVWACLGGTSLLRIAEAHADLLARGDIPGSRTLLPWLCGRDPVALEADDLARAVVESVAENTADAAVATVFWAAVAGPAGAVAHRAANTLDAMVGHRS